MIIYKCDKCKKEVPSRTDLYYIRAVSEVYDDREGAHYWKVSNKTKYFEVCKECEENLLWLFTKQFDQNEEEVETGKKMLAAMKESAEAVKNRPHYDFSCVTSLFDEKE